MVKTAIENGQNLIVEGCYIPFDWRQDFGVEYLMNIKYGGLILSENYLNNHFDSVKNYANVIERRLYDDCLKETLIADNKRALENAKKYGVEYILIDDQYEIDLDLL